MKPWQRYLKSMIEIEEEHVAEDYREGRGVNETDERDSAVIRREFAALKEQLPLLLAAEAVLTALNEARAFIWVHGKDRSDERRMLRLIDRAVNLATIDVESIAKGGAK